MKFTTLFFAFLLLNSSVAWSQAATYSKIDESVLVDNGASGAVGWGSCVTCAGGDPNGTASIASSPFITTPSVDGASRDFNISGSAYTNGLWWYKVGTNDAVSHFKMDFWLNVTADTQYAQALEFDVFQFNKQITQFDTGTEFMFGTQCNYAAKVWDVWDASHWTWLHTGVACNQFNPNTWYHLTLNFHSSPRDHYQHYDSLTIAQYNSRGKSVSNRTYKWNIAVASHPLPAGWGEDMGLQFQMDIANAGASMTEYVDSVSLTVW
ncbi:MAG: hypothetical protein ACRD20_15190 [Terriglobales bacterium]